MLLLSIASEQNNHEGHVVVAIPVRDEAQEIGACLLA
jgi:hypothetical protein